MEWDQRPDGSQDRGKFHVGESQQIFHEARRASAERMDVEVGAKQGKNDVRDFQRDLETVAVRFPDVTEREIRQIFWNGIRGYLRLHLIGKGLNPERSSIQKLVKYASRHEAAKKTLEREKKGLSYNPSSDVVHSNRDATDDESSERADEEEMSEESEGQARSVASTVKSSEENEENEQPSQFRSQNFLPQEEYLRLRREGRCFRCKDKGHLSRHCPEVEPSPPVEVLAARFADKEDSGSEEHSDQNGSDDEETSTQNSDNAEMNDTAGSYADAESSDDKYSDSSDEYYVSAMRIDLRSDRGHRLEGERLLSRFLKKREADFDAEVQGRKVCGDKP
ncbi:hypothetical protein C8R47DRAFT_1104719 [Mycena vitilis]|nr:hypothetical protein C8R47DRAFT_1104719 [Mycena vitilis]